MELRLGSVLLLLTCSLQQSLLGILASVPQTEAKQCKHKASADAEPVKKVQMLRRIPARCSGWDQAWSWLTSKDCKTKYVFEYVELPSAVQKVESEDCQEENAASSSGGTFSMSNEKFLAIVIGSASVAVLILIIIIIVSVCHRSTYRCTSCGSGPTYTSANGGDRDETIDVDIQGGQCQDDTCKSKGDPVYEEIFDKRRRAEETGVPNYENTQDCKEEGDTGKVMNGLNQAVPKIPSAPREEEFMRSERVPAVQNEYGVLRDNPVRQSHSLHNTENVQRNTADKGADSDVDKREKKSGPNNGRDERVEETVKESDDRGPERMTSVDNTYSEFDELISYRKVDSNRMSREIETSDKVACNAGPPPSQCDSQGVDREPSLITCEESSPSVLKTEPDNGVVDPVDPDLLTENTIQTPDNITDNSQCCSNDLVEPDAIMLKDLVALEQAINDSSNIQSEQNKNGLHDTVMCDRAPDDEYSHKDENVAGVNKLEINEDLEFVSKTATCNDKHNEEFC